MYQIIIFGVIGFAILGGLGLIIGLMIGYYLDKEQRMKL